MNNLKKYKSLHYKIPEKSLAWRIYGKGMDNFGDNKSATEISVPEPKDDEIMVRSDAVGLCFSDTKIIKFGEDHPRLQGRDLKTEPVIPGHEVSLTVIKVGKNWKKRYRPGEKYIIQADVFYKGKSTAYGYILPGGLSQYGIIGEEVLDGDESRYLIPLHKKDMSYSEVALAEPWACVVAAYRIKHREGIKEDGTLFIIGSGKDDKNWNFENLFRKNLPKSIILFQVGKKIKERIAGSILNKTIDIFIENTSDIKSLKTKYTEDRGFDDIIILGDADSKTVSECADSINPYGILNYMATEEDPQWVEIDAGKIHYDRICFVSSLGTDVSTPYTENPDYELRGESVLLLGAGGPMGQMHVQLVLDSKNPPKTVIATDIATERTQTLCEKFSKKAKGKGINFHVLNPDDFKNVNDYKSEIIRINDGKLFDYVICLAAIPAVIEDAASYLGDRSILNIFAGVSRGTIVMLNIKDVAKKSVRFIGSSGSTIEDMKYTLGKVENGELNTNSSVAGISGMNDVWNGIDAVRTGTFPGKIIVYPHINHMDLISIKNLKDKYPKIGALLSKNGEWTKEAEDELLNDMIDLK